MEPPRLPGGPRGVPVPLIVLAAVVVLVVLWPRLAPAPVPIPDERPLAIPTATHAEAADDRAPQPRTARRDPAALAAQAPPGPELAIGEGTGRRAARRRGRARRERTRTHRGEGRADRLPASIRPAHPVPRVVAPPRRWDGDLLP